MKLDVNKVVTLGNEEIYLIIDKIIIENINYLYIAELNKNQTDILDNYKIVKVTEKQGKFYLDEIIGEEKLKKVLPSFVESLSS